MPSNTPLTDAINALTRYANETTGASDTNLSDAVGTLVAGYGGGGGGISIDDFAAGIEPSGAVTLTGTSIAEYGILRRSAITSITSSTVLTVGGAGINSNQNLTSISLTACTAATGLDAFGSNQNLVSVNLPELVTVPRRCFFDDQKLKNVNIPKCPNISDTMFQQCYALEFLDAPSVTAIATNGFFNARKLSTLILRHTSVVTLQNISAFTNTPMRGYNSLSGTIYVPSALISSYQTANNWATLYGEGHVTFAAIEGSQYE